MTLNDPMELESLSRGDLECGVPVLFRDPIDGEPLRGSDDAAGESDSDHECVGGFETLSFESVADISVVLRTSVSDNLWQDYGKRMRSGEFGEV